MTLLLVLGAVTVLLAIALFVLHKLKILRIPWGRTIATLGFLIGVAGLILSIYFEKGASPLAYAEIARDDHCVIVWDVRGRVVLKKRFETQISVAEVLDDHIVIGFGKEGPKAGFIDLYNRKEQLKWSTNSFQVPPQRLTIGGMSNYFWVKGMIIEDLDNDGVHEILVWVGDPTWYLNRLLVLTAETGEITGSYLNPGDIGPVKVQDMDSDGVKEILVRGINNNLGVSYTETGLPVYVRTVFLLPGDNVKGMAPLTADPTLEADSTELWYLLITPMEIEDGSLVFSRDLGYFDPEVGFSKKVGEADFLVAVRPQKGFFYYLNREGRLLWLGHGDVQEQGPIPLNLYFLSCSDMNCVLTRIDGKETFHLPLFIGE